MSTHTPLAFVSLFYHIHVHHRFYRFRFTIPPHNLFKPPQYYSLSSYLHHQNHHAQSTSYKLIRFLIGPPFIDPNILISVTSFVPFSYPFSEPYGIVGLSPQSYVVFSPNRIILSHNPCSVHDSLLFVSSQTAIVMLWKFVLPAKRKNVVRQSSPRLM